jgi:hypothetical protein
MGDGTILHVLMGVLVVVSALAGFLLFRIGRGLSRVAETLERIAEHDDWGTQDRDDDR